MDKRLCLFAASCFLSSMVSSPEFRNEDVSEDVSDKDDVDKEIEIDGEDCLKLFFPSNVC